MTLQELSPGSAAEVLDDDACEEGDGVEVGFGFGDRYDFGAAAALRKLAAIAKDSQTLITPSPMSVTFTVTSKKDGTSCGSFSQPAIIKGNPCIATYDTKFLLAALDNGGDCFDAPDGTSPALITGIKGNTHILMPIRTSTPVETRCAEEQEEPCEA